MIFKKPTCYWKQQEKGLAGMYAMMTFAGRLTINNEQKTDNPEEFIERMKRLGHGRVFEFGTVYIKVDSSEDRYTDMIWFYSQDPYSRIYVEFCPEFGPIAYITTNYRVLLKGTSKTWTEAIRSQYKDNRLADLEYMTEDNTPVEGKHSIRHTVVWDYGNSRVTMDSFRTHVSLSSLMMSTRYCRFSSPKYNDSLPISRPFWLTNENVQDDNDYRHEDVCRMLKNNELKIDEAIYIDGLCDDELRYFSLTTGKWENEEFKKWTAQQARGLLGLDVATKMIQCGYEDDWCEFFRQRTKAEEGPHPDAILIASQALSQLGENSFVIGKI